MKAKCQFQCWCSWSSLLWNSTLLGLLMSTVCLGQVTDLQPRICHPGKANRMVLTGKDLDRSLRIITSRPEANVEIEQVSSEQATIVITLPENAVPGSIGVWTANASSASEPWIVMVDDLPDVARAVDNVSRHSAQVITLPAAISGASRGPQSDFYSFRVEAGQEVSFEVLTQSLHSTMDPVLRLLTHEGSLLVAVDDDGVGPEARFCYRFEQEGDYTLEVLDSRFAAGGNYHLRIGDFPILLGVHPVAIQRGQLSTLEFAVADSAKAELLDRQLVYPNSDSTFGNTLKQQIMLDAEQVDPIVNVTVKRPGGQTSAWRKIGVTDFQIHSSTLDARPLPIPSCYAGQFLQANHSDHFKIRGCKGQTILVNSRTRSLGSPCLLGLQLNNEQGTTVAESNPSKEDEWSLQYQFPDDAEYTLQACDLLGRFGSQFVYAIELSYKNSFALAVKGDANSVQRYMVDAESGCVAVDLLVKRGGYEGEIELSLQPASAWDASASVNTTEKSSNSEATIYGLKLLAATIPAEATEHRVYLAAGEQWSLDRFCQVRMVGHAAGQSNLRGLVSNLDIWRVQRPYLPYPESWNLGSFLLAGKAPAEAVFALDDSQPLRLARHVRSQPAGFQLKRLNADYKATPVILPFNLPSGWSASFQPDKDIFNATLSRNEPGSAEQSELQLLVYGEHNGQGFLEKSRLPIEWFDPVQVTFELPEKLVTGSKAPISITVQRQGPPAPITIQLHNLPGGVQVQGPIVIAADKDTALSELIIEPDCASGPIHFQYQVSSKFHDQEYSFNKSTPTVQVLSAPTRLEVYPALVRLDSKKDKRQMVVTGLDSQGTAKDWTSLAEFLPNSPDYFQVRDGVITPLADGESTLTIKVGNVQKSVPVHVTNSQHLRRTDFESEVLAAFSKQGCNSGACHGSPSGKGMFRLSLRAFDPPLDELTLIREEFGRRINTVEPEQSLLLLKPLMKVAHGGGKQIRRDDVAYRILVDWIQQGGKPDPADKPRCISLVVHPSSKRTLSTSATQQLSVLANFADGSQRDITELAVYESSDRQVASVNASGLVTTSARGEAVILVRFLEHIESVPITCLDPDPEFHWDSPPANNFVDELVNEKLRSMQYLPSETCSDSEFLRRVHLDVVGILPSVEEVRSFLGDSSSDKRSALVDSLLKKPEYAKFWALKWGDLLKLTNKLVGTEAVHKYYRWIEHAIASDMPYDLFARELITASGSTLSNPPANFYRTSADMNECVETISQVFLGARLQCAKCHNHPFERWTQDNYYGLAAFFNRVARKETMRPGEMFVWASDSGEVIQPRTGQQLKPWLPVVGSIDPPVNVDRRQIFADWLTKPDNPFLAKMGANRIWSHLFARGIIDPVDDFRDSNPASNEPLLDALAVEFHKNKYSSKQLLRIILNSRTYQASCRTIPNNKSDTRYFSHQYPRMMKAEQLLDAINQLTGVSQAFGTLPSDWKATQLPAPDLIRVDFLKVFGQPERSTVCACERSGDTNLAMAIELFNGPLIHDRLRDPNNRFRKSLAAGMSGEAVLDELYLAGLCRLPEPAERDAALAYLKQREDQAAAFEDICWAMINTDEFLFQH